MSPPHPTGVVALPNPGRKAMDENLAFRRAYGLKTPEWAFWEPLLLMVDEVYRGTADTLLASAQSKFKQRMAEMKRRLQAAMTYPEVLHASRVAHLKRNLNTMRKQ
ncbi:hypothetical protein QJQ45_005350 [Haematococcus lacustris]|nr:hypothetical protein QJQ45_005350 [Haematococcus lacustris]